MRRIIHTLAALALLPALISAGPVPRPQSAPRVQACHYEALVVGDVPTRSGHVLHDVPIGRIEVTACSSPADLAERVETLTAAVRAQATAQAATR
jgi:hypothetical protein